MTLKEIYDFKGNITHLQALIEVIQMAFDIRILLIVRSLHLPVNI